MRFFREDFRKQIYRKLPSHTEEILHNYIFYIFFRDKNEIAQNKRNTLHTIIRTTEEIKCS